MRGQCPGKDHHRRRQQRQERRERPDVERALQVEGAGADVLGMRRETGDRGCGVTVATVTLGEHQVRLEVVSAGVGVGKLLLDGLSSTRGTLLVAERKERGSDLDARGEPEKVEGASQWRHRPVSPFSKRKCTTGVAVRANCLCVHRPANGQSERVISPRKQTG